MRNYRIYLSSLFICFILNAQKDGQIKYYGKDFFLLEGTIISDSLKENRYDRLPISYKEIVRQPVWDLSKSSAGLSIRFITNSTKLKVNWEVLNNFQMDHMPDTGIKGIDLYFKQGDNWQYINTGRPQGLKNEYTLIENMNSQIKEFKVFLPLYDGIKNIEIGIDSSSFIKKSEKNFKKPIIFYGTSITQGGCASRPGMVHTNIISRKLDVEVINFGFSGNGRMEKPIAELISSVEPLFYLIECMPNMISPQNISERTIPLVDTIREKNPNTPIIFVDLFKSSISILNEKAKIDNKEMDDALRAQFNRMINLGYKNIYYLETPKITDTDNEGTVDGVHFTDLGFKRYADFLLKEFTELSLID
tara:strand:- start:292 stop:1377 length:1086 start_codon:yes stop_codon:yes gene_type:complete